jgi:hypothetical protein
MKLGDRIAIVIGGSRSIGKAIADGEPGMRLFPYGKVDNLPNSRLIHRNAFFGNH